jgi:hypothetical protein
MAPNRREPETHHIRPPESFPPVLSSTREDRIHGHLGAHLHVQALEVLNNLGGSWGLALENRSP